MPVNLHHNSLFFNRELSWIKFNERVIEEAEDKSLPILERLKFISIFSSNLDEFFMIRVAGVKEQIFANVKETAADGLKAEEVLNKLSQEIHALVERQSCVLMEDILPTLKKKGIRIRDYPSLRKIQKQYLSDYFKEQVFPLLTPLAIDPSHPFPELKGLGINLLVELKTNSKSPSKIHEGKFAVIHIPLTLPRFIQIPMDNDKIDFVTIEQLVRNHLDHLFPNMKIASVYEFRITRNADLDLSEAEADDLLKLIERELRKRRLGTVIRLEVSKEMGESKRHFLMKNTGLKEVDVYDISNYIDLSAFMEWAKLDFPELKDLPFTPALNHKLVNIPSIFHIIKEGDILLHHPYDSFNHVIDFVQQAAEDPQVLAIKQTLYRTSGKSPIVKALKLAVENGKQVTALIELKARFDEQNNIAWAKELDRSGVNVVYGVLGLKTHCKISMCVRQEEDHIRRYLHLSTGNYNATTARIYTDLSLLTCNEEMGEDASGLFNLLTGYSLQREWNKFLVAPLALRDQISQHIIACIKHHNKEEPSRIIMVINSLVDPEMIRLLYKASMAGIKVDLIVRGICCLKPNLKDISENITVKSIVGRFLEHSRIYYFKHSGQSQLFTGSADLMQRNLDRRVELVFPIEDPKIKRRVRNIIQYMLDDTIKSRYLTTEGTYLRRAIDQVEEPFDVQKFLLEEARKKQLDLDTTLRL